MQIVIGSLQDAGYIVRHWVLTASDYALPQRRVRLYIIGVRKSVPNLAGNPTHDVARMGSVLERLKTSPPMSVAIVLI